MTRKSLYMRVTALAAAAALVLGSQRVRGSGAVRSADVDRDWRRRRVVETLATQAAIDTLKSGRQCGRRGRRRRRRARRDRAVLVRHRRRRVHGHSHRRTGRSSTIDGRETAPAAMTPTSFWENGVPLPFNDARFSGMSVGVPGTRRDMGERAGEVRHDLARGARCRPAIRVARDGYVIDQTWFDQANVVRDWFDDIPASATLFLDPDGTPRTSAPSSRNPDLAATYERIAHLGPKGFYRGAVADAIVNTVQQPVDRADRRITSGGRA